MDNVPSASGRTPEPTSANVSAGTSTGGTRRRGLRQWWHGLPSGERAAVITAMGGIIVALITGGFLLWNSASQQPSASSPATSTSSRPAATSAPAPAAQSTLPSIAPTSGPNACADSQKAVADEIQALNDLIGSLVIRDAGTDHAIATDVNSDDWNKGVNKYSSAMAELSKATGELPYVDPQVKGRAANGSEIISRLRNEVQLKQSNAGPDTRQLTDNLDHFVKDIQPNICSGKSIPNA